MTKGEMWSGVSNSQYTPTGTLSFSRQFSKRFLTSKLIVFVLFFCLILCFYIRCYYDINTADQDYNERIVKVKTKTVKTRHVKGRWKQDGVKREKGLAVSSWGLQLNKVSTILIKYPSQNFQPKESSYNTNLQKKFKGPVKRNNGIASKNNFSLHARNEIINDFKTQWLRYSEAGLDWKGILSPCKKNIEWKSKISENIQYRTSGNASEILSKDIRPAGEFSRILIQSKTANNRVKTVGGDSWRVYVKGPSSLVARVFDYNNGTYEALFLVMEPGVYKVDIILDYSLCDGLRNPPLDWFIKGNKQGKYQREGILGNLDDFLFQRLGRFEPTVRPLIINVPAARVQTDVKDIISDNKTSLCTRSCRYLWNGYGRWVNNTWIPYFQEPLYWNNHPLPSPSGTLWVYGDSVAMILVQSMRKRTICSKLYKLCKLSYNWIYPILTSHKRAIEEYDDLDFDEDRVLESIREVLSDPDMDSNSTLLLNLGLHFVMTINFAAYQKFIDHVVDMLTAKKPGSKHDLWYKCKVVWKSTTAIMKEYANDKQLTHFRFLTSQRILLFNAYATWAMCRAGIDVVDAHPITDSYPAGPMDVVHYYGFVTYPLEQRLEAHHIDAVAPLEGNQDSHTIQTCIRN